MINDQHQEYTKDQVDQVDQVDQESGIGIKGSRDQGLKEDHKEDI